VHFVLEVFSSCYLQNRPFLYNGDFSHGWDTLTESFFLSIIAVSIQCDCTVRSLLALLLCYLQLAVNDCRMSFVAKLIQC